MARLDQVVVAVDVPSDDADRAIGLSAVASGEVKLGPVTVRVEGVGVGGRLDFPEGGGNLGFADLDVGFRPPTGLSLRVDSRAVSGAGFLSYDPKDESYSGGVDLEFTKLRLSALGLLATRMPDGRKGFSLLVVVNARFPEPIPLGLGFRLAGVGGLVGINRAVDVAKLRDGLRTGALSAILAPGEAVREEPGQLLRDLAGFFPVTPGRHVFGPTARLTWGLPTVATLDLGLALELPQPLRFIAAGRVRVALPDERAPIALLNMDAFGVLDTGEGTLALDATLYDSQIAGWQLSGDMALRARWSGESEFVLSVGGFHPRFTPPPGFPALRRVTMALGDGDVRLRLEAYLALTPNTLQLGARVEVAARMGDVTADGHFSFDALVRFVPFGFELDLSLAVQVRWKGKLLFGLTADLHVEGPGRWHVRGQVTIELLGLKATKRFTATFGQAQEVPAAPPQNVAHLIRTALAERGAWQVEERAALPALTMRTGITLSDLLVSPSARVTVRQKVAPVGGIRLDRVGQARIEGDRQVRIQGARLGGAATDWSDVHDAFSPGQFLDLDDEEKLARQSFEAMPSGVAFDATDAIHFEPGGRTVEIRYETFVVDEPNAPARRVDGAAALAAAVPGVPLSGADLDRLAYSGAAARAATRSTGSARFDAPGLRVGVAPESYVVVDAATLAPAGPRPGPGQRWSRTEATEHRRRWLAEHPAGPELIVVPATAAQAAPVRTSWKGLVPA
ncbi:DUF6603 domain-containing protein [Phytohabitans rumicis]|uniref:DUF6603 domain-containing protein n=1 Tax=Phytohabitans rumicis TaxID=1076125 RepID=UPI00280ADD94|nr:DUF6603 domain-containing protein [Phytohabitans rumicis]